MTRLQSTKSIRLALLTVVLLGTLVFIVSSDFNKVLPAELSTGDLTKLSKPKSYDVGLNENAKNKEKQNNSKDKENKAKPKENTKGKENAKGKEDAKGKENKDKGTKEKAKATADDKKEKEKSTVKPAKTDSKLGAKESPKESPKKTGKDPKNSPNQQDPDVGEPTEKDPIEKEPPFKFTPSKGSGAKSNEYKNPVGEKFDAVQYYQDESKSNANAGDPKGFLGGQEEVSAEEEEALMSSFEGFEEEKPEAAPKKLAGVPGPNGFDIPDEPYEVAHQEIPDFPSTFVEMDIRQLDFRIYSHNIKNGGHDTLVPGEEPWGIRFRKIVNSIRLNSMVNTIVTLQEVYKFQLDDIMKELNRFSPENEPEWSYYGAGRINGQEEGEFVPILYRNSEWELVFGDTQWLNEKNPRMALEGWDAKYLRIFSYVTLRHIQTENILNVFNTHFDHVGEIARIGSANLILSTMNEINEWPCFLTGDLNAPTKDKAYTLLSNSLKDSAKLLTPFNRYGHLGSTVTGFEGEVLAKGQNIDYIFVPKFAIKATQTPSCDDEVEEIAAKHMSLKVKGFGLLHSKFDGMYMSDHRPLVGDYVLAAKSC